MMVKFRITRKKLVVIVSCLMFAILFSNCIGYVTLPWKTVNYYTLDKRSIIGLEEYRRAMMDFPESCWDNLLIDIRTVGQNDKFQKTTYPMKICFNFITDKKPAEGSLLISNITIADKNGKIVKLYAEKLPPQILRFEGLTTGDNSTYYASFSTEYVYHFVGRKNEIYSIHLEMLNKEKNETKVFELYLKPFVEKGFGYWRL